MTTAEWHDRPARFGPAAHGALGQILLATIAGTACIHQFRSRDRVLSRMAGPIGG